jgi:hypothetical protein
VGNVLGCSLFHGQLVPLQANHSLINDERSKQKKKVPEMQMRIKEKGTKYNIVFEFLISGRLSFVISALSSCCVTNYKDLAGMLLASYQHTVLSNNSALMFQFVCTVRNLTGKVNIKTPCIIEQICSHCISYVLH